MAILDSGATHHLRPSYKAFISYNSVYNQYVTLADDSKICIAGKVAIAIEMGRKKMIICDVYHVLDLRLPLFSLRVHRRFLGCGYHIDNNGVFCFLPTFQITVDNTVGTYVRCRYIGCKKNKVFDYIQPHASAKSAAAGSIPRCSARLNPPPPTPTLSVIPPVALPAIPETAAEGEYDDAVELDVDVPDEDPTAPMSQAIQISKDTILLFFTNPATPPPDVCPCDTPDGSESLQYLTSDKIYHLFDNCRFRNYEHFGRTSKVAKFVQGG